MKIYFSGSIRGGREDQHIYVEIIELLKKYGTVLTEHVGDPNLSSYGDTMPDPEVFARDVEWVEKSEAVVAEVTQPSLGVGYEIGIAEARGKKILCLYRPSVHPRISAMVTGNPHVTLAPYEHPAELAPVFQKFFAT